MPPTEPDPAQVAKIVEEAESFLFDCDGVLWNEDELIEGVVETLIYLRRAKKKILFVTNNATKSRAAYAAKLQGMGIPAERSEVYCSAYAAAAHLSRSGFSGTAFIVGAEGLEEEMAAHGIPWVGGAAYPAPPAPPTLGTSASLALDPAVAAVVAGLDPGFTYAKLAHAVAYLRCRRPGGCAFVASNADGSMNAANGRPLPGAGAIVAAIEAGSGVKPTIVGKPHGLLLDLIVEEHGLDRSRAVMVGDRLDTDIAFGAAGGLRTLLVLTGVTTAADVAALREGDVAPDLVLPSVAGLLAEGARREGGGGVGT